MKPLNHIQLAPQKNIYFASDFHLGSPSRKESLAREKRIVEWLNIIEKDAQEIFLLGDIFDFWFEYKNVIPKGYSRFLGKLSQLCDQGIVIHYFYGNHDAWDNGYFEEEIGLICHTEPTVFSINKKVFFLGHGDGLGKGDLGYKFIKKVFSHPLSRKLFGAIHPKFGFYVAQTSSHKSRSADLKPSTKRQELEAKKDQNLKEFILQRLQTNPYDYFIFGHRHFPCVSSIEHAIYLNTGDWVQYHTYIQFDGEKAELKEFKTTLS